MKNPRCVLTLTAGPDTHHIITRGARPDLVDKEWNKIPLSRYVHQLWHQKGTTYMALKFLPIKVWLESHGWGWDECLGKWWHLGAKENIGQKDGTRQEKSGRH